MLMLSGALTYPYTIAKVAVTATASLLCVYCCHPLTHLRSLQVETDNISNLKPVFRAPGLIMDATDIMDLTHQKTRKRPRPISSLDESVVHASLKRISMRTGAECGDAPFMYSRSNPLPAVSLKQNDNSVSSSSAQVTDIYLVQFVSTCAYCL